MKTKWYFGILIAAFAFLAINEHDLAVPNQEIVLEFTNAEVTSVEVEKVISNVKKQLQSIGVVSTEIVEKENGVLKLAYHSNIDVEQIKKVLANTLNISASANFPFDAIPEGFNLKVYEILKQIDVNTRSAEKYIINFEQKIERFTNTEGHYFTVIVDPKTTDKRIKTAQILNRLVALAINDSSRVIPEVRAGPAS